MPPPFARDTFAHRFQRLVTAIRHQPVPGPQTPAPVLFNDTFTNYNHPEIGIAAAQFLSAAGKAPRLVSHGCCGRPLISQGMLDEARASAQAVTSALYDAAARGDRIVFLEPSCLSAVREDVPSLLRGSDQERAHAVARACVLFEDYVEEEWKAGRITASLRHGPATVLLHGHCHQKAMGLMPAARALAARIPSCTVVDLDAGCCGMAGSFGYKKEHYDVSRAIGERKLLPAARAMKNDEVLVAAGTSCREQIKHFAAIKAVHPAELLASLVAQPGEN